MDLWKEFLEQTKMKNVTDVPRDKGVPRPGEEPSSEGIVLSSWRPSARWEEIFVGRRTVRDFSTGSITADELAYLLWATQGITGRGDRGVLRASPSAGAMHPLDTYVYVQRVEGLYEGIYRFSPRDNSLIPFDLSEGVGETVVSGCNGQASVRGCAVTFIWAADVERAYWRFGSRAYRYVFTDCGHVCENLYIAAGSVDCGVCAIGAYSEDVLDGLLKLDGEKRFTAYAASLGKKK